jgi:hypothetical protein
MGQNGQDIAEDSAEENTLLGGVYLLCERVNFEILRLGVGIVSPAWRYLTLKRRFLDNFSSVDSIIRIALLILAKRFDKCSMNQ